MKRNDYEQLFLEHAFSLDSMTNSHGVITQCAMNIVNTKDDKSTIQLCTIISKVADMKNAENTKKAKELKDALVQLYGYRQLNMICGNGNDDQGKEKTLEELLDELNRLVGLENVKSKVNGLISYQKVQILRKKRGLSIPTNTLHLAFTGNPGTGKTTVARIVGRIYKQIGLLSKGHFIEVSRTDLIAGYQGQTALKVKELIEKAKGGVLFIDEAYSITENEHSDSYGRECLTELTKALEDYRNDLVVIVAGYTEPMRIFFESNPGLKSRFNTFIEFEDYSCEEVIKIIDHMCISEDYILSESSNEKLSQLVNNAIALEKHQFANGRFARNVFEQMIMNHACRVSQIIEPTITELKEFKKEDIPSYIDCQ